MREAREHELRAVYKSSSEMPACVLFVGDDPDTLRKLVGGELQIIHERLETRSGPIEYVVLINEDGDYEGMRPTIESAFGAPYLGPVLAMRRTQKGFASLGPDEARAIAANFDARAVIADEEGADDGE